MKKYHFATLLACILALSACAPAADAPVKEPEKSGYEKFADAYRSSKELDSSHYELSVVYDIVFKNEEGESSNIVNMGGSVMTTGAKGNNVSFLCDSSIKYPIYDDSFSEIKYYADGILYVDAYSAAEKTRSKQSVECMYGVALGSLVGYYEFMNFPESAVLSEEASSAQDVFSCTILSEKVSGYLYSFTATPLYDSFGTKLTKWEFSDIAIENTLTAEGYLASQKWTVTATGLIPSDDTGGFMDTSVSIQAELKLNAPGTVIEIAAPELTGYTS